MWINQTGEYFVKTYLVVVNIRLGVLYLISLQCGKINFTLEQFFGALHETN